MSLKWLSGTKRVHLDELKIPDLDARLERARKGQLAVSLQQTQGPIQFPVMNAATGEVIGADRIAALHVGGASDFEVRQVTCSAAQWRYMRAAENAQRRQDLNEWTEEYIAALQALRDEGIEKHLANKPFGKSTRGRPKTAHGATRDEAAKELGETSDALRMREKRAKEKREAATAPPPPPPAPVDPLKAAFERGLSYNDRTRTALREAHEIATARGDQTAVSFAHRALRWVTETEKAVSQCLNRKPVALPVVAEQATPRTGLGGRRLRVEDEAGHDLLAEPPDEPIHETAIEYDPTDVPPGE